MCPGAQHIERNPHTARGWIQAEWHRLTWWQCCFVGFRVEFDTIYQKFPIPILYWSNAFSPGRNYISDPCYIIIQSTLLVFCLYVQHGFDIWLEQELTHNVDPFTASNGSALKSPHQKSGPRIFFIFIANNATRDRGMEESEITQNNLTYLLGSCSMHCMVAVPEAVDGQYGNR